MGRFSRSTFCSVLGGILTVRGAVLVPVCSGVSQGPPGTVSTGCKYQAGLGCGAGSSRRGDIFQLMCVCGSPSETTEPQQARGRESEVPEGPEPEFYQPRSEGSHNIT